MANLGARKPIALLMAEAEAEARSVQARSVQALTTPDGGPLKRTPPRLNLVSLEIGAVIRAGIFLLTGHVAAANAGPAVGLSFLLGAVARMPGISAPQT